MSTLAYLRYQAMTKILTADTQVKAIGEKLTPLNALTQKSNEKLSLYPSEKELPYQSKFLLPSTSRLNKDG